MLRTRRQMFANKPDWALGRDGLLALTGRGGAATDLAKRAGRDGEGALSEDGADEGESSAEPDALGARVRRNRCLARPTTNVLAGIDVGPKSLIVDERPALVTTSTGTRTHGWPNGRLCCGQ